jgi:hypothetical protein
MSCLVVSTSTQCIHDDTLTLGSTLHNTENRLIRIVESKYITSSIKGVGLALKSVKKKGKPQSNQFIMVSSWCDWLQMFKIYFKQNYELCSFVVRSVWSVWRSQISSKGVKTLTWELLFSMWSLTHLWWHLHRVLQLQNNNSFDGECIRIQNSNRIDTYGIVHLSSKKDTRTLVDKGHAYI